MRPIEKTLRPAGGEAFAREAGIPVPCEILLLFSFFLPFFLASLSTFCRLLAKGSNDF